MLKLLQITDLHYDPHYIPGGNKFCHQEGLLHGFNLDQSPARYDNAVDERYGRPGSECDAPLELLQETFNFLSKFSVDFVLWTGDSVRDPSVPRSKVDVVEAIRRVTKLVSDTFQINKVFPTIGNWDTLVSNQVGKADYEELFNEWKVLWTEDFQLAVKSTFLKGGFYSLPIGNNITLISLNTIAFYSSSSTPDCKPHSKQLTWLHSILLSSNQVIIIGHVPPITHLNEKLYNTVCLEIYTNLIGTFSNKIISQYFGHVNRDLTYFLTKSTSLSFGPMYEIVPLNQQAIIDPGTSRLEIVGSLFTGSSIVPYFYPSFREIYLELVDVYDMDSSQSSNINSPESNTIDMSVDMDRIWKVKNHRQYSAKIGTTTDTTLLFNETCSLNGTLGMNGIKDRDYKDLLSNIQHELDVLGKSNLASAYWDCSVVHYGSTNVKVAKTWGSVSMLGVLVIASLILLLGIKLNSKRSSRGIKI